MVKRITNSTVNKTSPRWRYELLETPGKQGFSHCLSEASSKGGKSLLRYINYLDLDINTEWQPSSEIKVLLSALPDDQAEKLRNVLEVYKKRKKLKRGAVIPKGQKIKFPLWSLKEAEKLNDPFFVRLVKHATNFEYDGYIAAAINLYNNKDRQEALSFLGYNFYAKKPDSEIAKAWGLPVKLIEALRLLFFDFSGFPSERLANFTCLRQLVVNGLITDLEFAYYKRIYELGELGLKAQIDFINLSDDEKARVHEYLDNSHASTVFNLNFSVQTKKDATQYLGVLSSLTDLSIRKKEAELVTAKIENLRASTKRLDIESSSMETTYSDIDQKFLDILYEQSLKDEVPKFKTIAEL